VGWLDEAVARHPEESPRHAKPFEAAFEIGPDHSCRGCALACWRNLRRTRELSTLVRASKERYAGPRGRQAPGSAEATRTSGRCAHFLLDGDSSRAFFRWAATDFPRPLPAVRASATRTCLERSAAALPRCPQTVQPEIIIRHLCHPRPLVHCSALRLLGAHVANPPWMPRSRCPSVGYCRLGRVVAEWLADRCPLCVHRHVGTTDWRMRKRNGDARLSQGAVAGATSYPSDPTRSRRNSRPPRSCCRGASKLSPG